MHFTRLAHVCLQVKDLSRSLANYCSLGLLLMGGRLCAGIPAATADAPKQRAVAFSENITDEGKYSSLIVKKSLLTGLLAGTALVSWYGFACPDRVGVNNTDSQRPYFAYFGGLATLGCIVGVGSILDSMHKRAEYLESKKSLGELPHIGLWCSLREDRRLIGLSVRGVY